jgi:SulP family sulfate permease
VLDTIVAKFARHGTTAEIAGLNHHSTEIHDRLSGHLSAGH